MKKVTTSAVLLLLSWLVLSPLLVIALYTYFYENSSNLFFREIQGIVWLSLGVYLVLGIVAFGLFRLLSKKKVKFFEGESASPSYLLKVAGGVIILGFLLRILSVIK